jgi:hypothetical protein
MRSIFPSSLARISKRATSLAAVGEGRNLRLKFVFALTVDHADYAPPKPGEQHCYREGCIVLETPPLSIGDPASPQSHETRTAPSTLANGAISTRTEPLPLRYPMV